MALGQVNLRVSKEDFVNRINTIETKMAALKDVVERYQTAKTNLDQFIEDGDDNYQAMIDRIDVNITAAKKAWTALQETRDSLQETVDQMEGMSNEVKETLTSATEAAIGAVNAAIKIKELL